LYRDAECVAWALQSLPLSIRPTRATPSHLSVFVVPALYDADNYTLVVHYLQREWAPLPGNPQPIAHMPQSREMSAVTSMLPPPPAVAHSVLEWCEKDTAIWFPPHTSRHTSYVTRHTSHVTRHTSHLAPHTSHLTPHTSHVTPHTSHLTPHTSHLTRHTSHVTPHTSHLTRHTSHLTPHTPCLPQVCHP
jgi:cell division septation protein DedD